MNEPSNMHTKCGWDYFWHEQCFPYDGGSELSDCNNPHCHHLCKFDGRELNSHWYAIDRVCLWCNLFDSPEPACAGQGIGDLFDHYNGDPYNTPEVHDPSARCFVEAYGGLDDEDADWHYYNVYLDLLYEARRRYDLLIEERRRAERVRIQVDADREAKKAASMLKERTRRFRRFEDRRARERLRIRRRSIRWLTGVQKEQRNALHSGRTLPDRPYVIADPTTTNTNNDLLANLQSPSGGCTICRSRFGFSNGAENRLASANVPFYSVLPDPAVRLPCSHVFHFHCITAHFNSQNPLKYQCPTCTVTFSDVRIMPDFGRLYAERVFNEDNDATSTDSSYSSSANTGTSGEEEDENEILDWGGDSDDGS